MKVIIWIILLIKLKSEAMIQQSVLEYEVDLFEKEPFYYERTKLSIQNRNLPSKS